ncbi:MAG: NAD(P)H-hydrate dehydratase [Phycisphaerae bacterium]|nr:NAD(P)H-hydrate dehydratase [Phycisphaerae bacterium]
MSDAEPNLRLPPRDPRGHKGTFGTVAIVGGTCAGGRVMLGAPALAALAALRAGAGLARLVMPAPILPAGVALCPSATGIALPVEGEGLSLLDAPAVLDRALADATACVIGPGLGIGVVEQQLAFRALAQPDVPVVADADALSAIALQREFWRDLRAPAVLTPHPGEFRTLARATSIMESPVDPATRPAAAQRLAQRLGCVVVLKGAGTIVSDGQRTWTCRQEAPALATGGTGDVLAGVIAGLIAQCDRPGTPRDLFSLACIAVEAHASAARSWVTETAAAAGLVPQDLCDRLPAALERFRS